MTHDLRERIARLERQVRKLKPIRTPGVLTSRKTHGVVCRPIQAPPAGQNDQQIPRFL